MASDMMDGFIAGKMDSGSGGCCYPVPMYGYGMPGFGGFGGGYGFGNIGEWFPMILIAGLLFGGGGFGFGGFGGGAGLQGVATRADINAGFQFQDLQQGIRGLTNGLSDSTYAVTNAVNGGFAGVNSTLCNIGYQNQAGIASLSREISECCCGQQRAIDGVTYNISKGLCDLGNAISMHTRDIVDNANANYRGIMDFLVQEKLQQKDAKIAELQTRASLAEQTSVVDAKIDAATAEILRRSGHDCPVGAYLVQAPTPINIPVNACGQAQFGGYGCCAA